MLPSTLGFSSILAIPALCFPHQVVSHTNADNYFVNPPAASDRGNYTKNPVFKIGQPVELRWVTNLSDFVVVLNQQVLGNKVEFTSGDILIGPKNASAQFHLSPSNTYTYTWNVHPGKLDLRTSNVFFLSVNNRTFTSHTFNITTSDNNITPPPPNATLATPAAPTLSSISSDEEDVLRSKEMTDKEKIADAVLIFAIVFPVLGVALLWAAVRGMMKQSKKNRDARRLPGKGNVVSPPREVLV